MRLAARNARMRQPRTSEPTPRALPAPPALPAMSSPYLQAKSGQQTGACLRKFDLVADAREARLQELGAAIEIFRCRHDTLLKTCLRRALDLLAQHHNPLIGRQRPLQPIDRGLVTFNRGRQTSRERRFIRRDHLLLDGERLALATARAPR